MERKSIAISTLLIGLIVGIIGNIVFYDFVIGTNVLHPGLSFPLFIITAVIAALGMIILAKKRLWWRNLWIILPMLFFAGMVAVRAEALITSLNIMATLSLGAIGLHYLTHSKPIDEATTSEQIGGAFQASMYSGLGTINEINHGWQWLKEHEWRDVGVAASIGRGLLFAVPIVILFAVLFSSADAVFSDLIGNIFALEGLEAIITRSILTLLIAWVSTGALAYGAVGFLRLNNTNSQAQEDELDDLFADEDTEDEVPENPRKRPAGFRLNMIETGIVLGSVIALFAFFVFIQFAYLFGGQQAINDGLSYATYARRGFFELVTVSVLVLGMGMVLDKVTMRRTDGQGLLFKVMSILLVGLTLVILASAWHRMYLYEDAFGFTHLRVYTHIFMIAIASMLGVFLLHIFRVKKAILSFGVLLVTIGYLGAINIINVEQFIAERNIARWQNGASLDLCYLQTFSVDALPAMLDLYEATEDGSDEQAVVLRWLTWRTNDVSGQYADRSIFQANISLDNAVNTLIPLESEIDAAFSNVEDYYPSCFIGEPIPYNSR